MEYELYGVGNALMDILVEVDEHHFAKLDLPRGAVTFVSNSDLIRLESDMFDKNMKVAPGGAIANTISMFTLLGGKGFFCGKVGNDELGEKFKEAMDEQGIGMGLTIGKGFTGRALTFITPDTERTFAVNLGVALDLKKEDVDISALKNSKFLHVGGHELEEPSLREVLMYTLENAKKNGLKISIDLADPQLIKRIKKPLADIIKKYADIIFANQSEAEALTGSMTAEESLDLLSKMADIAIIKLGSRGSIIRQGKKIYRIPGVSVKAVDTTGAGDAYAGSFLYGLAKGYDVQTAGKVGSFVAATVISRIGARLENRPDISSIVGEENEV